MIQLERFTGPARKRNGTMSGSTGHHMGTKWHRVRSDRISFGNEMIPCSARQGADMNQTASCPVGHDIDSKPNDTMSGWTRCRLGTEWHCVWSGRVWIGTQMTPCSGSYRGRDSLFRRRVSRLMTASLESQPHFKEIFCHQAVSEPFSVVSGWLSTIRSGRNIMKKRSKVAKW